MRHIGLPGLAGEACEKSAVLAEMALVGGVLARFYNLAHHNA